MFSPRVAYQLTRVIEQSQRQNLDIAAAEARVEQARARALEAGAAQLPQGSFGATSISERQSLDSPIGTIARHLPGYRRDQTLRDVGASAGWELDLAGGLRRTSEAARAEAQAAEAEQVGIRISVAAESADAYLQIPADQARLHVAQDQIGTDNHLLGLVRLRFAAGVATDREVAQAEALLAGARSTVPPLRLALELQMNRLDVLTGSQPGTHAGELASPADIPTVPAIPIDGDAGAFLRRRPDVIAAERILAASNARIGAALAEYYPTLSLSGLLGFESLQGGAVFSSQAFQPVASAIDLTDVLDADRQLLVAQDELAQTRAGSARAAVSSFRALGGGW